jgi:type IV pilus assembly protein PilQ
MKTILNMKIFTLICLLFLSACAGKNARNTDVPSEIVLEEVTRDGLTTLNETVSLGPDSNYNNDVTKPRRELKTSINLNENKLVLKPDFNISISFKNTRVADALLALGNLGGRNIIIDENVNGFLNIDINNEPWNVVFNSILESQNLAYSGDTEKGLIKVFPDIPSGEVVLKNEIFNIYYETPSKIKTQIESLFAGIGEGEASLILNVDDENKTIIAQGTDKQLDEIEVILNKIDVKKPQILIEAFLVEVKPTFETKLGSRIGLSKISDGQGGATTTQISGIIGGTDGVALGTAGNSVSSFLVDGTSGLGIIRNVGSRQLKVEIDALEKDGDSRTLSNPKLFTISGKNAKITQGTKFGVTETTTADGVTTSAIKYYDANLKLDVTPVITGDGNVMMKVLITNDTVSFSTTPPSIDKKEVSTNLVLTSGDIAVVGGILTETLSETNAGVPGLKNIPGVGALFRSKINKDDKTELLIFLAPRVI